MNPLLLLALVGVALADVDVQVGANGQLRFSPETVNANIGELVNFHFHDSIHSATESTARLKDPCHPLGGFDTGIQKNGAVQSIVISTHNSIYVHCTPHCGQGMVMIVNPGPNDSVETFRQAAIAQEGGGGGGGGGTTTTTASSTSTSHASSTSTTSSQSATSSLAVSLSAPSLSISSLPASGSASGSSSSTGSGSTSASITPVSSSATSPASTSASATTTGAAVGMPPAAFGSFTFFISSLLAILF